MAYTTPPAFASAAVLTAAQLNILSDDITDLDARAKQTAIKGASLLRSTNVSAPDSTYTAISWVSAPVDIGGWWSSGTNIVVPAGAIPAGYTTILVEIDGHSRAASNGTGTRQLHFLLNGGELEIGRSVSAINGDTTELAETVWAVVAAADVIVMEVKQNSGGALNFQYSSMHIKRLGPVA